MTFGSATDVGSVIMFVKSSAAGLTTSDTTLATYQHMSPTLNSQFDLENANLGRPQMVQLNLGTSATTLYVSIYNF